MPAAAQHARSHLLLTLRAWDLDTLGDTAQLLVSELVTNAVKAAETVVGLPVRCPLGCGAIEQAVEFYLLRQGAALLIQVWDGAPEPPARVDGDLLGEAGRGLLLVESLSSRWGHHLADRGGKIVWCELRKDGLGSGRPGRSRADIFVR